MTLILKRVTDARQLELSKSYISCALTANTKSKPSIRPEVFSFSRQWLWSSLTFRQNDQLQMALSGQSSGPLFFEFRLETQYYQHCIWFKVLPEIKRANYVHICSCAINLNENVQISVQIWKLYFYAVLKNSIVNTLEHGPLSVKTLTKMPAYNSRNKETRTFKQTCNYLLESKESYDRISCVAFYLVFYITVCACIYIQSLKTHDDLLQTKENSKPDLPKTPRSITPSDLSVCGNV